MAKALAKDPADRYASCREFIHDLAIEFGIDTAELAAQEATAHIVIASDDAMTRAIVRGSLANMGVSVSEVCGGEIPAWLGERRFDALIADADLDPATLAVVRGTITPSDAGSPPKLLLLVPRGRRGTLDPAEVDADDALAQPFSGMQLALKLRRLLGPQAVRV
jgi:DNA-binding response OmpR family regulator